MSSLEQTVLAFIAKFTDNGRRQDVIRTFTDGCCYWFAHILATRFWGDIVYSEVAGHFAARIEGRLYDITGMLAEDPTDRWTPWSAYECGSPHRKSIIQSCVRLHDSDNNPPAPEAD